MKRKKIVSLAVAGTLAVSAALAGTYAWQSISQKVRNDVQATLNPGGRLHDDFNGMIEGTATDPKGNARVKQVYVENFTETGSGQEIYARIRLQEYIETGAGAGKPTSTSGKNATSLVSGADFDDTDTWTIYKWDNAATFRDQVKLKTGNTQKKWYMPTYNMNKDSLAADINGTLAGKDNVVANPGQDDYDDYTVYTQGSQKIGVEIYDIDGDTIDELETLTAAGLTTDDIINSLIDSNGDLLSTITADVGETIQIKYRDNTGASKTENFKITAVTKDDSDNTVEEIQVDVDGGTDTDGADLKFVFIDASSPHMAKQTDTAQIIDMQAWLDGGASAGTFWVCDTDGWAYWAQPIKPGAATGCLIEGIELNSTATLSGEYYYGLNVVAEFATAGDWGSGTPGTAGGTGFYKNSISEDGLYLLEKISGADQQITVTADNTATAQGLKGGDTATFKASAAQGAIAMDNTDFTWRVEGNTSADTKIEQDQGDQTKATLTVGADENANSITVVAESMNVSRSALPKVVGIYTVPIKDRYEVTITAPEGAENTSTGATIQLTATVKKRGKEDVNLTVTWKVESTDSNHTSLQEGTKITETTGILTIDENEQAQTMKITAVVNADPTITATWNIESVVTPFIRIKNMTTVGTTEKVKIDGIEWYVVAKDQDKYLLWAADNIKNPSNNSVIQMRFNSTNNIWYNSDTSESSEIRDYLNGTFKNRLTSLSRYMVSTQLTTRKQFDAENTEFYTDPGSDVFLLSEADLFGKFNTLLASEEEAVEEDYTFNGAKLQLDSELLKTSTGWYLLRSPRFNLNCVAIGYPNGVVNNANYYTTAASLRPALWIDLSSYQ